VRAEQAEEVLLGELPSGHVADEAARRAAEATDPPSDIHASAAFRRKLARYTVSQAIELAAERARGA
jgi:carbon-monoxide dehydrogenase medium subunit